MTLLDTRCKEAIKTALAMTIAFGIALSLDWDKPYWAGFAVAMISLPTAGMSLNKGAMRMLGTLVAVVAALIFVALFSQERWWLMVALTFYVGFCSYMMGGKKHQYFYHVAAFVCVIVAFGGGADSQSTFQTAMTRTQETAMGILVYTIVAVFLWPRGSRGALYDAGSKLFATQRKLHQGYRGLLTGHEGSDELPQLRLQEVQLLSKFGQALDAAETDTYEVGQLRRQWRSVQRHSAALGEWLERWRQNIPDIQSLDLPKLLPSLDPVGSELDARMAQIEKMLAGEKPDRTPQTITLAIDIAELRDLSHSQNAALALTKSHIDRLEALTRSLFECLQSIEGYRPQVWTPPDQAVRPNGWSFDVDRFQAAIRGVAGMWLAFLTWIYLDSPGGSGIVTLVVPLGLAFALMPQLRVSTVFLPAMLSCAFAGVLYMLVMPLLSGYAQLALMIFGATFAINYLLAAPRLGLARILCLVLFLTIISVDNDQSYSFIGFASTTVMLILTISVLVVSAYIPNSPRPEKMFLRLLSRYFRHAEFLTARLSQDWEHQKGLAGRWKAAFYRNDLSDLAEKLAMWGKHIDHRTFPGTTPEQVQALVANLQALAYRIDEMAEVRVHPQADLFVRELSQELRDWRHLVERRFKLWADNPVEAAKGIDEAQARMQARLAAFKVRLDETFRLADEAKLRDEDYENAYRLLGGFRGLLEAIVGYARAASAVNWAQWQEQRF